MAHLAVLLKELGHEVSGSDQGIYSPMKELLAASGIPVHLEYDPRNIAKPDCVIVGNAIGRGNVELEAVLDRRLVFRSQAEVLKAELLERRQQVAVVAGTHGKTTCSAMLSWLLQDLHPGFLVGGIPVNYGSGARAGSESMFVVEGDEYDTAFFDKGPKFLHYRPWVVLLNHVELDHADIYADLDSYLLAFERLVNVVPSNGRLVMYAHGAGVERIRRRARCPVITFGSEGADHRPVDIVKDARGRRSFCVSGIAGRFETGLIGNHNIMNATGCVLAARELGIPLARIAELLPDFRGVRRRQELVLNHKGFLLYDDFAHHPTAIAETLRAFRESLPDHRLWAVFEPRSWSMRKNVFQDALPGSFRDADKIIIGPVFQSAKVADVLDPQSVADAINGSGGDATYLGTVDEIVEQVCAQGRSGDAIIVLSNGAFGGLVGKLRSALG